MNWLNLKVDDLLSSESYMGSEPIERATWLNLMMFCVLRENGGVVENSSEWGDRKWMTLCGVTKSETKLGKMLYWFEDSDLHVWGYDLETQKRIEASRINGRKGGRPPKAKAGDKAEVVEEEPKDNHPPNLDETTPPNLDETTPLTIKKRKEKKRKGKEKTTSAPDGSEEFSELKIRIGKLVLRRASTQWSEKEIKTLIKLKPTMADIEFLEGKNYSKHPYRRKSLITLLNNWGGEQDRMNSVEPSHHTSEPVRRYGV